MQIAGHEGIQVQNIHFQVYTHGMGLAELRDTLNTVSYVVDLKILRASDPSFKSFLNRWKLKDEREKRIAAQKAKTKQISTAK